MTLLRTPSAAFLRACAVAAVGFLVTAPAPASGDADPALRDLISGAQPADLLAWARRYEHGEGVARDFDAAVMLYCRAAEGGLTDAGYQLGWMYANGRGVVRDDALAAAWFAAAAAEGDTHARRMLGRLPPPAERALCVRPDGQVYRAPIESVPDPSPQLIADWVERLAPEYALDPGLVLAVIRTESNFNPRARSPKNAQGLMQLIPATARRFKVEDPWDPLQNIRGGMTYLRWLLNYFKGDENLALAGYNAGEGAVIRYKGIPPYAETRAYVRRISLLRKRPTPRLGQS
jgi:soluble lytic murein transglycosylase-like protein